MYGKILKEKNFQKTIWRDFKMIYTPLVISLIIIYFSINFFIGINFLNYIYRINSQKLPEIFDVLLSFLIIFFFGSILWFIINVFE